MALDTVVILGKSLEGRSPLLDFPDAQVWGCTHTYEKWAEKKWDLSYWHEWYDIHLLVKNPFYTPVPARRPRTWKWYQSLPANDRPVYLVEAHPSIPASRRFPVEEIEAEFPPDPDEPGQMWTCQVDYMMAFAALRRAKRVVLWGHGVSRTPAHMLNHRGQLYWTGVLRGRGIRVTIVAPSWLRAPAKRYGYECGGGVFNMDGLAGRTRRQLNGR